MKRKRNEESLPETQGFVHHNVVERYTPNGARYVLTNAIFCLRQSDIPLTGRGLKHLIHRKRSPFPKREGKELGKRFTFSFSGDANPFVLAEIYPNRGITQWGRQGVGVSHTTNVVSVPNTVILNGAYAK